MSLSKALVEHAIEMETIPESTSPSKRESLDDPFRREMLWRPVLESLVIKIRDEADETSRAHRMAAKKARKLYHVFGIPTVLIPLTGSMVATYLPQVAVTALLLVTSVCGALSSFLALGARTQLHFEYSARWSDLANSVKYELAKSRADRCAADVFIERLRNQTTSLRASEPQC